MPELRRMTCACCGNDAGRWQQWWNRDTGYGLCARCATWLSETRKMPAAELVRLYGVAGIHREAPPPAQAPREDRVPCQACWSGDHSRCYTAQSFDCLCAASGHPTGPFPIPLDEDSP